MPCSPVIYDVACVNTEVCEFELRYSGYQSDATTLLSCSIRVIIQVEVANHAFC